MLENLEPAPKISSPPNFRPGVEFDGTEGVATTPGYQNEPENFDEFLVSAGLNPEEIEVIPPIKTSRWQQREGGDWLTSYRFTFRRRNSVIDLPLLWSTAKKIKRNPQAKVEGKAFVICPADYQVGKVSRRGGSKELIARVMHSYDAIEQQIKKGKYDKIIILDCGDMVEGFDNAANQAQLQSNDLGPMQQVDVATSLLWDLLKRAYKHADVEYASVGSNHCQWRSQKQRVGLPGVDDWGIFILRQLQRLTEELDMDVKFYVPDPDDESLAFDVFGDQFHILGLWHGHQSNRPEQVPTWWRQQAFGQQPVAAASIGVTGHFHHTRIQELGSHQNGGSRWWIQASTSDSGSDWFRLMSGEDSMTAITAFELEKGKYFQGQIWRF